MEESTLRWPTDKERVEKEEVLIFALDVSLNNRRLSVSHATHNIKSPLPMMTEESFLFRGRLVAHFQRRLQ